MEAVNHSYRALRRTIGILGIALPILLIIGNGGKVEKSISFFYYTNMSTLFTGILITFALVLYTYRGTDTSVGKFSENLLTTLGGIFALIVALVPTKFGSEISTVFYAHNDSLRGWIHNISALLFIFLMGLVVLTKFGKSKYYRRFYKTLGILVLAGLAFTVFAFAFYAMKNQPLFKSAVFWGESFSLWAFGIAWLRRGVPYRKR